MRSIHGYERGRGMSDLIDRGEAIKEFERLDKIMRRMPIIDVIAWLKEQPSVEPSRPFPDNATNGDVIKAMFPNTTVKDFCTGIKDVSIEPHHDQCFSESWWNAPYKGAEE